MAGVRRGAFTCVWWKVTLCDPIWQVMSRSYEVWFLPGRAISAFAFTFTSYYEGHPINQFQNDIILLYQKSEIRSLRAQGQTGRFRGLKVPKRSLPIHLFIQFCCGMYRLSAMHSTTDGWTDGRRHYDAIASAELDGESLKKQLLQLKSRNS